MAVVEVMIWQDDESWVLGELVVLQIPGWMPAPSWVWSPTNGWRSMPDDSVQRAAHNRAVARKFSMFTVQR